MHDPPDEAWADRVAESICANLAQVTGNAGSVIPL